MFEKITYINDDLCTVKLKDDQVILENEKSVHLLKVTPVNF